MIHHRWRWFVQHVLRRAVADDELDAEIRTHLALETERRVDAGESPDEARRGASRDFGNVLLVKDVTRDRWGWRFVERWAQDMRYGARMLRKRPGFTAVAVVSLAIGIGANTAIFTLVNASLLREDLDLVDRPDELVDIYLATPDTEYSFLSHPIVEDLREGTSGVFSGFAVSTFPWVQIDRARSGVEGIFLEVVTGDYFATLGVEALLGRPIAPEDDVSLGGHPVVMLNYRYWQRRFGGDPNVVGRELRVNGRAYTIIGVAPADYPGAGRWGEVGLYAPMSMVDELTGEQARENRGYALMIGKARFAPGVTRVRAETAVTAVAAALDVARPEGWDVGNGFTLVPTLEVVIFPSIDTYLRQAAGLLFGVVGLVLLLACTNLASFLLARARERRREMSVRLALGASRGALVRQLLTETTLLSLLGGIVGLGLATWLLRTLLEADLGQPLSFRLYLDLDLDGTVLAFTGSISMLAGTLLGLVPALQTTRPDVVAALKEDTAGGGQRGQIRWRNGLVVTQLTVSLVLMVGAGLFLRDYQQRLAIDPGFGRDPTALMTVRFPTNRYTPDEAQQLVQRLSDRFRAMPGVDAVGSTSFLPLGLGLASGGTLEFNVDGHEPPPDQDGYRATLASVDAGFFDAAGIPLVQGRIFTDADGAGVTIISEAMAQRFWPHDDAVGHLLRGTDDDRDNANLRVVGVAQDVKVQSIGEAPALMVYRPHAGRGTLSGLTFVARTSANPDQTARALVTAGRAIDPELMVLRTETMTQHLENSRLAAQLAAFLLSAFGVLALVLSVVGLYGVVSYAVASRTREVGIRMALGASAAAITRLLTGSGLRLVLVSSAIGLTLSLLVTRVLSGLFFGVGTLDPVTFVVAPLVLLVTSIVAVSLPALRVSRIDPVAALRAE